MSHPSRPLVGLLALAALVAAGVLALAAPQSAEPARGGRGRTLQVGPTRQYKTIADAAAAAGHGDTVVIDPGIYRETVRWRKTGDGPPITIRGAGADRTIVDGVGISIRSGSQRALFQIDEGRYVIEGITFRNGRNGHNGAGVRLVRTQDTVIRRCRITDNDMGVMSTDHGSLLIEHSEISFNGTPDFNGYSHNTYLEGDRVTVRFSYLHDGATGQNFKARTRYIELLYNYIADAHDRIDGGEPTKEIGLQSGNETASPHSHAVLIGNVIIKSGRGHGFIDFGPEGKTPPRNGTLYMAHNTVIREANDGLYIFRLGDRASRAELHNNIFYGTRQLARGDGAEHIVGSRNWFPRGSELPPGLTDSIFGDDPGFVSLSQRDYRLRPDSPCLDRGIATIAYRNGAGEPANGKPLFHYLPHLERVERVEDGRPDLGAFELPRSLRTAGSGTLAGRVADPRGAPLVRLPVTLRGSALQSLGVTALTNEKGEYSFTRLPEGSYTVSPWPNDYTFTPPERNVEVRGRQTADFAGPATARIRGRVSGMLGTGVKGTSIFVTGPVSRWQLTSPEGTYEFTGLPEGQSYLVTANRGSYEINPREQTVERLQGDTTLDFSAKGRWLIEGKITTPDGTPLRGVMVKVAGADMPPGKTNERGNYQVRGLAEGGTYTITPSMSGYSFSPPSVTFESMDASKKGTHFSATPQ